MGLAFRSPPRISQQQFQAVLTQHTSPCAAIAGECYAIVQASAVDPAVALAFFGHESVFGTRGIAVETRNWGNVRTAVDPSRTVGIHPHFYFVIFRTWQDSLIDWCERINVRYIEQRKLDTVEKAVPVYAPSLDGNIPQRYIDHVLRLVDRWIAEDRGGQHRIFAPVVTK